MGGTAGGGSGGGMGLISIGFDSGSIAAVGRLGVNIRALDTLGVTVATFLGSDALGRALALGSSKLDARLGSASDPVASSDADFWASVTNCLANCDSWEFFGSPRLILLVAVAAATAAVFGDSRLLPPLLVVGIWIICGICASSAFLSLNDITFCLPASPAAAAAAAAF